MHWHWRAFGPWLLASHTFPSFTGHHWSDYSAPLPTQQSGDVERCIVELPSPLRLITTTSSEESSTSLFDSASSTESSTYLFDATLPWLVEYDNGQISPTSFQVLCKMSCGSQRSLPKEQAADHKWACPRNKQQIVNIPAQATKWQIRKKPAQGTSCIPHWHSASKCMPSINAFSCTWYILYSSAFFSMLWCDYDEYKQTIWHCRFAFEFRNTVWYCICLAFSWYI